MSGVPDGAGDPRPRWLRPRSRSGLLSLADVDEIVTSLRRGGLAVLPTETGYALAADATSIEAVGKAFAVKRRDRSNPMHVACSSLTMARRYGVLDPVAAALVGAFTPGPLTMVVPQTDRLPDSLVTLRGTVGLRVPDCACTLQVIAALDRPLTATSLNRSGQEYAPVTPEGLAELDWPAGETVHVVRHDAVIAFDKPSTLVSVADGRPRVLRAGAVGEDEIVELLAAVTTASRGGGGVR